MEKASGDKAFALGSGWLAGAVAFPTVVRAGQVVLFAVGVGVHRGGLASIAGGVIVGSGAAVAGLACEAVSQAVATETAVRLPWTPKVSLGTLSSSTWEAAVRLLAHPWLSASASDSLALVAEAVQTPVAAHAFSGMAVFLLFGGRFFAVAPSHVCFTGAYAKQWASLPARGASYATTTQKRTLRGLARRAGCHSCGVRRTAHWVADHMPPNAVVQQVEQRQQSTVIRRLLAYVFRPSRQPQRFYPQCRPCSQQQAAVLAKAAVGPWGRSALKLHSVASFLRPRYLWLPVGFVLLPRHPKPG
eukprot:m.412516 g.412516  ORF g.412516 m.412516 type:complete len:302 (+) comp20170_c2_seq6:1288-2193(+)